MIFVILFFFVSKIGNKRSKVCRLTMQIHFHSLLWSYLPRGPIILTMTVYTLTGHFITYTLLVRGLTPFCCLQNCLNYLWHRFSKVLETLLRDFGPYWHDSITQLLQICRLHIHDANLPFHHIPNVHIGLRSGDCGGPLSKVNSLSCLRMCF